MAVFAVPLVIRGKIIGAPEKAFGGRRAAEFSAPDLIKHVNELTLSDPSQIADLYEMNFEGIVSYLAELGERLEFRRNAYLQQAFELSRLTSGLTENILKRTYESIPLSFNPTFVREYAESAIGLKYLEGWVQRRMSNGALASVRAFGARTVHVVAGNSPTVSVNTVVRNAITRSDAIIKTPSNDPLTAAAVARTMIDFAPDHPITKHVSVAYWKGGDSAIEDRLYQPRNIEKIIAWGGLASITHIAKYIQPGIDLITLDPKLSSTIVGREAFESDDSMADAAERLALDIGTHNQEACLNARVIYIETGCDPVGLEKADRFGELVYDQIQRLPSHLSGPAVSMERELVEEIEALRLSGDDGKIIGGGVKGAIIVSHASEPVDFSRILANRVANLVPVDDLRIPVQSTSAYTQTIGIYPDALRVRLRDALSLHGAQRTVSLGYAARMSFAGPHDGMEPLRRMCRWIVDEEYDPRQTLLGTRSE